MRNLDEAWAPDTTRDRLLAPLPQGGGAGIALRYEPVYLHIQEARRHDDDSVPMGDWERPLVRADWRQCATLCSDALATQGKDLQVAAWLVEAWTRLDGLDGMLAGVRVLQGLVERYWDTAWPRVEEDGDTDARCAPFIWLDHTLALACSLHIPLLHIDMGEPFALSLDGWDRTLAATPFLDDANGEPAASMAPGRDELLLFATHAENRARLHAMQADAAAAEAAWRGLERQLDERLGQDAPSLRKGATALSRLARAAASLLAEHSLSPHAVASRPMTDDFDTRPPAMGLAVGGGREEGVPAQADEPPPRGMLLSRAHAYRELARIAQYLAEVEPHSPTPYLLRKAVAWGEMSLAELMHELTQDDAGFARYLALLSGR